MSSDKDEVMRLAQEGAIPQKPEDPPELDGHSFLRQQGCVQKELVQAGEAQAAPVRDAARGFHGLVKQPPPFRGMGASARPWYVKARAIRARRAAESGATGTGRAPSGRGTVHIYKSRLGVFTKPQLTNGRSQRFCRCEFERRVSNSHLQIWFIKSGRSPVV